MKKRHVPLLVLLLALPLAGLAQTAPPSALPAWDKLSPEQREALIAPVRERWNAAPDERARMLEHAQRWKAMSPEEREKARRGMRRFDNMPPEERERARVIFIQTRKMTPEQRTRFQERWEHMSPEQREQWLRENRGEDRQR